MDASRSITSDEPMYDNPFRAMLEHGRDWAQEDLSETDMIDLAQKLGGPVVNNTAQTNLSGFAQEIKQQQTRGEK